MSYQSTSQPTLIGKPASNTVTIDYDQVQQLFLSKQEKYPFSAEKLLQMLNSRAKEDRVQATGTRVYVHVEDVHCVLTHRAVQTLSTDYQRRRDWQIEYPFVSQLFPASLPPRSHCLPLKG